MKKNILLLLFCLLLSSCYVNKFNDYEVSQLPVAPPSLDSKMWIPITTSPIYIDAAVPYVSFISKKNIIYIYLNNKKQLIYLEHNPQANTTRQQNISSVLSPSYDISQLTYTEYGSQKILGIIEQQAGIFRFRSYFIYNNFSTKLQYDFKIAEFGGDKRLRLHFHSARKGNLLYTGTSFNAFNLTPSAEPPAYALSDKASPTGTAFTDLSRAGDSLALYYEGDLFKTYNFTDGSTINGPAVAGLNSFVFSLREANDIWLTTTTAGKMGIYKVTVKDDGGITEESIKTDVLGSKGIIAKGSGSGYFLASQNAENKIEISQTTDNFETLESIGVANSGVIPPTGLDLLGLSGALYLSYVSGIELTILKYSKKGDDSENPEALPTAKITMESSKVTANVPFSVSAAASTGNNLTYFWYATPNTSVIIDNPVLSTTKITLPPSPSKVTITLEINDGIRSSSTTQEVTVS